ncbi:MAG TPA: tRNA epoxyqueuosine(34) reductase QueG [Bryobacteraceae bacterium]|nr:tRNA epoxyqueuosine(34) reductase QueG [Bryobacteraceae bacterium]
MQVTAEAVKRIARECGFELAGVAAADPPEDFARYDAWVAEGRAGEMRYLTDRRAEVRRDVRNLLANARCVICVGKLYNQASAPAKPGEAVISRYAWGADYHELVRAGLEKLVERLKEIAEFDCKICVDTAPILERSFARLAGLGWIGKNTCLINEPLGSWFFLGEIVISLEIEAGAPPEDRCGTCSRCIDACPTDAIVPQGDGWAIDSRNCIAYWTIELRGSIPEERRAAMGAHVFGCDICQDVCPWNARAPVSNAFEAMHAAPSLEQCARLTEGEYRTMFHSSAIARAKYPMFLRNVAIAMGNSGDERFHAPLRELAHHTDGMVAEQARWALAQ